MFYYKFKIVQVLSTYYIIMLNLSKVLRFIPIMYVKTDDVDFTIAVLRRAMQNYYETKYHNNL